MLEDRSDRAKPREEHLISVKKTYEISVPSVRTNIRLVEGFILRLRDDVQIADALLDRILVAVTEAVNNGIVHGNDLEERLHVRVRCSVLGDRLQFSVRDQGPGFSPEQVPDPLLEENLLKEGGRGIHIIRSLMDSVEFRNHPDGMEIVMTILTNQAASRAAAPEGG
jgi:serine/threonine-protein kinase RsbW